MKNNNKYSQIIIGLSFLMIFMIASGCGEEEKKDGKKSPAGVVSGRSYMAKDGHDFKMPHLFTMEGNTRIISFSSSPSGIYYNDNPSIDPEPIDLGGEIVPQTPTRYTVNNHYLVWLGSSKPMRHQWNMQTKAGQSRPLLDGLCITKDLSDDEILVGVNSSGDLFMVRLYDFVDWSPSALTDPDNPGSKLQVDSFACDGDIIFAATSDGRVYKKNVLETRDPQFVFSVGENHEFGMMQYEPPYLVWVDKVSFDIYMYDESTGGDPIVAVNTFPLGMGQMLINDLRIFGSTIVWSDMSSGNYDIWGADLSSLSSENDYTQLTTDAADQRAPFIFVGKLYWEDHRNDYSEIWSAEMSTL